MHERQGQSTLLAICNILISYSYLVGVSEKLLSKLSPSPINPIGNTNHMQYESYGSIYYQYWYGSINSSVSNSQLFLRHFKSFFVLNMTFFFKNQKFDNSTIIIANSNQEKILNMYRYSCTIFTFLRVVHRGKMQISRVTCSFVTQW